MLARRRVTSPLARLYYRLPAFLPAARESRRRHAELYKMYEDMYDRLQVWRAPSSGMRCSSCAGIHAHECRPMRLLVYSLVTRPHVHTQTSRAQL